MPSKVQIINRRDVFKKFIFRIEEVTLKHEKYDGTMSDEMVRLSLDRGDAVAAVIHRRDTDELLFTEQFRYPAYENGQAWLLEVPAGMIRRKEEPEDAMRRELLEETGFEIQTMQPVHTFYVSPGGTSERIFLYYAAVSLADKTGEGGGVYYEGEDIRPVWLHITAVEKMLNSGEFHDAKTIVGLQWFILNRHRLDGA